MGKTLPTTYNGSHLTIGGKSAPILFVSPAMITAQVPVDTAAGSQPVVVANTNGPGAPTNLTIAGQAPARFTIQPSPAMALFCFRITRWSDLQIQPKPAMCC